MKIINKIKTRKSKKDYEKLLLFKDDLEVTSLKVSLLNDKIRTLKTNTSLSFDKMNSYIIKISACYKKDNLNLCKRCFVKFIIEESTYLYQKKHQDLITNKYLELTNLLAILQESYLLLDNDFKKDILSEKLSFKNIFSTSINNFSKRISQVEDLILELQSDLSSIEKNKPILNDKTIFKTTEEFEAAFNSFLKSHL